MGGVTEWLEERLHLAGVRELARKKQVPEHHHSIWYYFGGISLFLFLIQVFTGILLMVYYAPTLQGAHASVQMIVSQIEFGWLIRSVHSWAANLMILAVFVHMFSAYFMKAYRRPRELTWLSGMGLLGVAMGFGFSGYLLPWDELAYFATKVGLEVAQATPVVGPWLATLLRGGEAVGEATIHRFFTLHVMVFPLLFSGLLGLHLYLVQLHGNAAPPGYWKQPPAERRTIPFFPNFFYNDLLVWLISLNVLAFLASLYPWDLGPEADPIQPAPAGIHPEWYFMAQFQLLKMMPAKLLGIEGELVGMFLFTVAAGLWALVPLWDRETGRRGRLATYAGLAALMGLIGLTILGYAAL